MSRHSKNNTAHSIFTQGEKQMLKDWGTVTQRLGGDSIRPFDACNLCLQSVANPMVCTKGHLFCKECIYKNMLDQQTAKKKQLALWSQYQKNLDQEMKALSEELQLQSLENFERVNSCVPDSQNFSRFDEERKFGLMNSEQKTHAKAREHVENLNKFNSQILRKEDMIKQSFWVPALTPSESAPSITKPDKRLTCPVDSSSHFIKRKKLIPVKCEREERSRKIICKCCKKTITHQKAGVISICGDLICMTCITEYCKEACVACGISISEKSIIQLTPGGTMFSAHNLVEAKVVKPVFNC